MGSIRKPRNESDKAILARITKEMAQPRIAKSARKGGVIPTRLAVDAP